MLPLQAIRIEIIVGISKINEITPYGICIVAIRISLLM